MTQIQPGEALSKFPEEAILIAQILGGWGDVLQLLLLHASQWVPAVSTIEELTWSIKTEAVRVDVLSSMVMSHFNKSDLEADAEKAVAAVKSALRARNKYAHCHWGTSKDGRQLTRIDWTRDSKLPPDQRGTVVTTKGLSADLAKFADAASRLVRLQEASLAKNEALEAEMMASVQKTIQEVREHNARMIDEIVQAARRPLVPLPKENDRDQ